MPCMNRRPVTAIRHDRPYWPPSACGVRPVARSWAGVRARDRIGVRGGSGPQLSCIVVEPVRDVPCSGVAADGHDAHTPGENSSLFVDNAYTMGNLPSSRWTLHGRRFPAAVITVAGQGVHLVVPPLGRPPAPPQPPYQRMRRASSSAWRSRVSSRPCSGCCRGIHPA